MKPVETCEVCAQPVHPSELFRAELSVGDMMCPTPMTFHRACYEAAAELWQPNVDSYCTTDPEFPETAQWTPTEEARRR